MIHDEGAAQGNDETDLDPEVLEDFAAGKLTVGDLTGFDKESQQKVAEIGLNYLNQGRLDEARTVFEGLLVVDPYEPYFLAAVGAIAHREEAFEDAESWYSRALEAAAENDQEDAVTHANRGEVRLALGRVEEAVNDLSRAIELDPKAEHPTTERAGALLAEIQRQLEALAAAR